MFILTRRLPDGTEKTHGTPFTTLRAATVAAAYVLHDNRAASKAEAQRFSVKLGAAARGEWVEHASGYAFRVDAGD
ncbi:hypothetical protein ACGF12_30495 [Kitasatospora sp. NPDC048296]|uniref:hypothetical protein n=1 Tax=Kitasatospora sp. NPDC048296 TaxID=3364048 RepID=UPI00371061F4